ncbi:MAG TPA: RNA methyltransferase [Egibacteraceae bacterium]|nr:RNA methyltransferase [Egibacteraceae bacterium]
MAVVTSVDNAAVKAARKLARRPARDAAGAFLVEGPQAVREALGHLTQLFVTDPGAELAVHARQAGVAVTQVSDRVLAALADTVTPQGVVGVAELPALDLADALAGARLAVVCWRVADPGNLGTVLRTADAGGADALVCTAGSVDPRNPKAVRASAGSLFHLPVVTDADPGGVLAACRAHGLQVVAADAGGPVPHTAVDFTAPTALLLGNEAHGLPGEALAGADVVASVPILGRAESLNLAAAAAVIVYEAARQRGRPAKARPCR